MSQLVYQPLLPTGNRYLQQKWDKAAFDMHRRKVISVKPTLDTTPPKAYGHLALKMKKHKLEEERMSQIQRENSMLLEKISLIMRTTGQINNKNDYEHRSLSRERRHTELQRITVENQRMLQRLGQSQPHYSSRRWHDDWLRTLRLRDNISIFPRTAGDRQASSGSGLSPSQGLQYDGQPSVRRGGGGAEGQSAPPDAPEPSPQQDSDTDTEEETPEDQRPSDSEVQEEETGAQQEAPGAPEKSLPPEEPDAEEPVHAPSSSDDPSSSSGGSDTASPPGTPESYEPKTTAGTEHKDETD